MPPIIQLSWRLSLDFFQVSTGARKHVNVITQCIPLRENSKYSVQRYRGCTLRATKLCMSNGASVHHIRNHRFCWEPIKCSLHAGSTGVFCHHLNLSTSLRKAFRKTGGPRTFRTRQLTKNPTDVFRHVHDISVALCGSQ